MSWLTDLLDRWRRRRKPPDPPPPPPPPAGDVQAQLLALHVAERSQAGLPALRLDPKLTAAAQGHADFMAHADRLGHSGIGDGDPWTRIRDQGYAFTAAAENIAEGYQTPAAVMAGWMSSTGHRANIMGQYADVGFGQTGLYWCADFGTQGQSAGLAPFRTSGGLRA